MDYVSMYRYGYPYLVLVKDNKVLQLHFYQEFSDEDYCSLGYSPKTEDALRNIWAPFYAQGMAN